MLHPVELVWVEKHIDTEKTVAFRYRNLDITPLLFSWELWKHRFLVHVKSIPCLTQISSLEGLHCIHRITGFCKASCHKWIVSQPKRKLTGHLLAFSCTWCYNPGKTDGGWQAVSREPKGKWNGGLQGQTQGDQFCLCRNLWNATRPGAVTRRRRGGVRRVLKVLPAAFADRECGPWEKGRQQGWLTGSGLEQLEK